MSIQPNTIGQAASAPVEVILQEHARPRRYTSPPPLSAEELERLFHQLAAEWRRETAHVSFISRRAQHPAYQQIVALGMPVVSLLLRELERDSDDWTWALSEITGEDPSPPTTYLAEVEQAWLEWGRQKGYL